MTKEILIPFPPNNYSCRDGKEIKTWMDGYEAAVNDLGKGYYTRQEVIDLLCKVLPEQHHELGALAGFDLKVERVTNWLNKIESTP